ncbi:hypothetical protein [Aureivirga sp. CE67]|uniref:hypothetical protein n=1 Tax=Aureivirga sp. CE67 TaxID=1788983 RepID=UPI0018CA0D03|nr:hypothetical protein [Aureivirga sp. CE67]
MREDFIEIEGKFQSLAKPIMAWTPKYKEKRKIQIDLEEFKEIVPIIAQHIDFDLKTENENSFSYTRKDKYDNLTELIEITHSEKNIHCKSTSLREDISDYGSNETRVRLFFHAFKTIGNEIYLNDEVLIEENESIIKVFITKIVGFFQK